jgi:membrane fusion protein (multidrug efflux system)
MDRAAAAGGDPLDERRYGDGGRPDGKVAPRQVRLGPAQGSDWIVFEGLKAGEQVMVDGFQKLRGGAPVKAVPWKPLGAEAAAAPGRQPDSATKSASGGDSAGGGRAAAPAAAK